MRYATLLFGIACAGSPAETAPAIPPPPTDTASAAPAPAPAPAPVPAPAPAPAPAPVPAPAPAPVPVPVPAPAPVVEPTPAPTPTPEAKPADKPKDRPKPKPADKPADKPAAGGGGDATAGRSVFDRWCAKCHGGDGRGGTKMGERLGVKDMTAAAWQSALTDAALRRSIREGNAAKKQPAFGPDKIDDAGLRDLVAFVRTLGR